MIKGWNEKMIKEFAFTASGGTPSTSRKDFWEDGNIPWINSGELSQNDFITKPSTYITILGLEKSSAKLLPKGSVVVALTGTTTGMSAYLEIETSANQSVTGIFPSNEHDGRYLFYQLKYNRDKFLKENIGSAQPHINKKIVDEFRVLLPSDVKEQSLIAHILFTIDKAINATQQIIGKYKRIKTGLLQDLLTRGMDKTGKLRSEETHEFKDSPMGRIPIEWTCMPLGEVYADVKSGGTPLRKNRAYFENGTHLWVKTLDLNEGEITNTQEKITDIAISESSCSVFPIDSILIAMYGGWEQIGRTGILKKEATTNQALSALFNPKVDISPEYVQFFLQYFRYKWKLYAVSTRKDPNITKTDIQNFQIFFPKDKDEQLKVVSAIQTCDKNIHYTTQNLTKLQSLKTGLMQDLLSGNVRVDMKNINKQHGTKN